MTDASERNKQVTEVDASDASLRENELTAVFTLRHVRYVSEPTRYHLRLWATVGDDIIN
jgi:hypothetical protein